MRAIRGQLLRHQWDRTYLELHWLEDGTHTERRHEANPAKGDSDSDCDSGDVGWDNHGTKAGPGTRSGGVLAMAAVTVVCAAVVLVWLAQLPPGVTGHR